jgi:predicted nucleic acid-binding protein
VKRQLITVIIDLGVLLALQQAAQKNDIGYESFEGTSFSNNFKVLIDREIISKIYPLNLTFKVSN